ncbi:hypothetical protein BH10CHL1_BH10CHL1_31700 [soil metagenome]
MSSHHLPQLSTGFVGRDQELSELAGLLADSTCRLLTVVGPGGIGKTRLAIQVAASQHARFANGVAFVALAPVVSVDFLPAAIGSALEFSFFGAEEPLYQIMRYLRDKQLLLVMDNFEHLLVGSGCLAELLHAAPQLKILATSRERLNLREEWVFTLDGLAYPPEACAATTENYAGNYSAVQLFVQRARQVQHHFSLADDLPSVLSICRQVEGMPLGLELAASWLRAMPCQQIAARMASSFDFLTTPLRNMPERHRSLRAVFGKSWRLLLADEQAVLMRLSLFHGGFDGEAASAVAGATLSVLAGLVDKSMLRMTPSGRYDLHELVRQYAQDQLTKAGEIGNTTQRHLAYFMQLVESGEAYAYGREQVIWYDRLEVELDNLRAALAWSLSHAEIEIGLRIAGALRWVWEMRGHIEEGLAWFTKLLAFSPDSLPPVHAKIRAKAFHRASEIAGQLAHEPQATIWAQEALRLARLTNDQWNLAWSLSSAAYFTERDSEQAVAMLEESLALFGALQDPLGLSHTRRRLAGCAIDQHNYGYATKLLEEALAGDRQAGDKNTMAWDLCFMGVVLWSQHHRPEQVIPLYQESIALFRELKDLRGTAHPLVMLAEAERCQGNFAQALTHFQETLRLEQGLGIRGNLALLAMTGIASLAVAHGQPERAAGLLGAVNAALASDSYKTRVASLVDLFDATADAVRTHLSEDVFNAAWSAGHIMSLEQAITEARQAELPPIETTDGPIRQATNQPLLEPLSPRELDVLHLLGAGLSNAQIAQKLFIAVATVKVHTRSIYGKLNVSNRTQAVVQAQQLNLF